MNGCSVCKEHNIYIKTTTTSFFNGMVRLKAMISRIIKKNNDRIIGIF